MKKALTPGINGASEGNMWKKFTNVSVGRGKTVFPRSPAEQERFGVRWDFDGEVVKPDGVYNKFRMQPNAGKIPSSIKAWRDANGGTHAVMADAYIKKEGSQDDVQKGLEDAAKSI
ncbi:uncharacterized protein SEPMUDRAFT_146927 [Sphaerulina musiva SO2202]|uniref:Uncharacterized protein n=1 Tax=Sphaerulina musiva (strain SO2202) TaxID=692275 RepID=M3C3S3_SPHMS|nr:uncharacterized protein SEPMUDRAFT_146927 [Sphaerulina musiva SO2202]EMF14896.1 hypothetical protein SEPMUDRAFT_146927 [Sphaerulina musiva SO2202]